MKNLTIKNPVQNNTIVLEHSFIDHFLSNANGEFVKVYLILLRYINDPGVTLTIPMIADLLNFTEGDVTRALNYWKKQGVLDMDDLQSSGETSSAKDTTIKKATVPESNTTDTLKEVLYIAEQYLGKTLSRTDMQTFGYLVNELQMSSDLVEYLIAYCVQNGHTSIHYIKSVALAWYDDNVHTVSEAKKHSQSYNKTHFSILESFGIKGRAAAPREAQYISRWTEEWGFSLDIVLEACNRTIQATHKPSFAYADSILDEWHKKQVHSFEDIRNLDQQFLQAKSRQKANASTEAAQKAANQNKFNNFSGRTYGNMDELTRKLIQ